LIPDHHRPPASIDASDERRNVAQFDVVVDVFKIRDAQKALAEASSCKFALHAEKFKQDKSHSGK
jgi:hypothetical protein